MEKSTGHITSMSPRSNRSINVYVAARRPRRTLLPTLICATVAVAVLGCSKTSSPRRAIHGTVRLDAADVVSGSISFLPTDGNRGPATTTAIVSGQYRFSEQNGPYGGAYRIVVGIDTTKQSSGAAASAEVPAPAGGKLAPVAQRRQPVRNREPTPAQAKSQWDATFVVPNEGDQRKDFDFVTSVL
jgi:hypothetical protein